MSINDARKWLIMASLIITAGEFLFFLIAPIMAIRRHTFPKDALKKYTPSRNPSRAWSDYITAPGSKAEL
jgi:hypothetical protein